MRIISIIFVAALIGAVVGGAVGYVEVRRDLDPINEFPGDTIVSPKNANEALQAAKADDPRHDFGTMQRGTSKSHEFTIRNVGTAPLKLRKGTASCKCTDFIVPEDSIAPGATAKVKVVWSAKSDTGPFHQTANVLTDDPLHPSIELTINGEIMSASGVEPGDFSFDKIPVGESRTAQVYVMAMLQDELTVSDPELSDPATRDRFDVKIEPAETKDLPNKAAKRGVRISVTAKPGLPIGRFAEWLSLKTSMPEAEKLEIPISGQIVGDISVRGTGWNEEAGAVKVGSVKSGEGKRTNLSVAIRGESAESTKFEVKSVDPPEMKVTLGEPKKLKEGLVQVPVEIEIPLGTRPMVRLDTSQGEAGKILLSTTHPKIKELAIGVHFAVER
jgi:Protein of unknown function (DUF1573)